MDFKFNTYCPKKIRMVDLTPLHRLFKNSVYFQRKESIVTGITNKYLQIFSPFLPKVPRQCPPYTSSPKQTYSQSSCLNWCQYFSVGVFGIQHTYQESRV